MILIQETMGKGDPLVVKLRKFSSNWNFLMVDSHGLYRGLIIEWNHKNSIMNYFSFSFGLCTKVFRKSFGVVLYCA